MTPKPFWAMVEYPWGERTRTLPSPSFATQPELVAWIRAHREGSEAVHAYRRDGDRNVLLFADEHVEPDPERVERLIAEARRNAKIPA